MKESVISICMETYTIDETIHCKQYEHDDIENTRQIISEMIINTQEEQIREALIKLGWTPPKAQNNQDISKTNT